MGSEVEITETPNWLKDLEAKRERRLKRKLGHELGAGAPCLTCEDKCPGLDLHFWRKICKNCKCSKENHEVQDDDIYGWAQDELLGTKVNRLKRKIVLPGRKDEVELEWAPNGQKETIDKYLKTLPPELLPIKGSQAAQDRKQLLKKQIPIHDIDPTLCHELTDEELKKMQEYISHIKESSVGIGHLIQINLNKGKTHVLNKNEAMFLINNVPKGMASSENVLLKSSVSSVPLKNLNNLIGITDENKKIVEISSYQVSDVSALKTDEQNPIYATIRTKHYNVEDSNCNSLRKGSPTVFDPKGKIIVREDVQHPEETCLKSLNFPDNCLYSELAGNPEYSNPYGNSTIKNLVPSAFVPIKHTDENYTMDNSNNSTDINKATIKDLPYPSHFITNKLNYGNKLPTYNSGGYNILEEHQNPAYFEPIKDLRYLSSENIPAYVHGYHGEVSGKPPIPSKPKSVHYPLDPQVSGLNSPNLPSLTHPKAISEQCGPNQNLYSPQRCEVSNNEPHVQGGSDSVMNQTKTKSPLPHLTPVKTNQADVHNTPVKIKSIRDLAYSTYDCLPDEVLEDDFRKLSVKDRLEKIEKDALPVFTPKGSSPSIQNVSPSRFAKRNYGTLKGDDQLNDVLNFHNSPYSTGDVKFPHIDSAQSSESGMKNPSLSRDLHKEGFNSTSPRHTFDIGGNLAKNLTNSPHSNPTGQYKNLPSYTSGNTIIHDEDLNPTYIPVGGIRDVEYENLEIRTAYSRDNDLFEGSAPNKFVPDFISENLPCCHYCKKKFEQDDLAIAIPERSDAIYHTSCFKCHGCNQILADMFYFYDKESDHVYCGRDYAKIRGVPRCGACDELIFVKEYCLAENSTFHVKHFCCFECDKPLAGQNYVMENDQPVCVPCYELTKANKCYACREVIHPDQQGLQLKDGVHFHATEDCFACKVCNKPLFGAKLLFRKDNLYCSHDCYNSDV